jgi:AraC family transcriptional regulator
MDRSSPGRQVLSSERLGWRTVLARTYADPMRVAEFAPARSADLLVVLVTKGSYVIESGKGQARYRPGSIGVTAPGNASVLRWWSTSEQPLESLHITVSAGLIAETGQALGRMDVPDALELDDPVVLGACQAIGRAVRDRAPALYADSMALALAAHLLYGPDVEAPAKERTVARVTAYMREHLHEDVNLDDLAAQANLSKYHLLRMFKASTGFTPHRYLVDLRMRRAAQLLSNRDRSVLQVAVECGYRSPGQFAAAFRRMYGVSPGEWRQQQ